MVNDKADTGPRVVVSERSRCKVRVEGGLTLSHI